MMKLTIATHPQETPGTLERGLGHCMGSSQAHACLVGFADYSVTPITAFCFFARKPRPPGLACPRWILSFTGGLPVFSMEPPVSVYAAE